MNSLPQSVDEYSNPGAHELRSRPLFSKSTQLCLLPRARGCPRGDTDTTVARDHKVEKNDENEFEFAKSEETTSARVRNGSAPPWVQAHQRASGIQELCGSLRASLSNHPCKPRVKTDATREGHPALHPLNSQWLVFILPLLLSEIISHTYFRSTRR